MRSAVVALLVSLLVLPFVALSPSCSPDAPPATLVFAAASTARVLEDLARAFEASTLPGHGPMAVHAAGTPTLVVQIRTGAPADVFVAADTASMQRVVETGRVASGPWVFAENRLAIVVAAGNPRGVRGLADLGVEAAGAGAAAGQATERDMGDRGGLDDDADTGAEAHARAALRVALCGPNVPAGRYARQALAKAGVSVHSVSDEPSVRAVVGKVALGEIDAGIVYATDIATARTVAGAGGASPRSGIEGVAIDDAYQVTAHYPIAVLTGGRDRTTAAAFAAFVRSAAGRKILQQHGFGVR